MILEEVRKTLMNRKHKSAFDRGITQYALELLDNFEEAVKRSHIDETSINRDILLNGAHDWTEYSYGGCSFIFDSDIAERLCTPSELKKKKGGELQPNSYELWLDVQARALNQACERLLKAFRDVRRKHNES